jgi:DNA-binding protein HU-beta
LNKKELVARIAAEHELTGAYARELVDTVFNTISEAVQNGEEVSIFGFGTFRVAERGARKGRNPATGEAIKIAASKNLRFTTARSLKVALNTKRRGRKQR